MADKDLATDIAIQQLWANCLSTFRMNGGQLLWQNPNPNDSYSGATLTNLPNMSSYSYLVFIYKYYEGSDRTSKCTTYKNIVNSTFAINDIFPNGSYASRQITIDSATQITIGNGWWSSLNSNSSSVCVPVAIYGTNDLGYIAGNVDLDNQSLYNLGYYDSAVDNGDGTTTITRQTGYINRSNIIGFNVISGRNFYIRFNLPYFALSYEDIITNVASCYNCYEDSGTIQCNFTSYTDIPDLATLTILLQNFSMQYKLPTSYTEKVIANVYNQALDYTLLWENGSPNSSFNSGQITTQDMTNFKYIVVTYKKDNSTGGVYIKKYEKIIGQDVYITEYVDDVYRRNLNYDNNTRLTFGSGVKGTTSDNSIIIPIAIYGTNVL